MPEPAIELLGKSQAPGDSRAVEQLGLPRERKRMSRDMPARDRIFHALPVCRIGLLQVAI